MSPEGWMVGDALEVRHRMDEFVLLCLPGEIEQVNEAEAMLAVRVDGVDGNNLLAFEMRSTEVEERPYWVSLDAYVCPVEYA